jgi:circadian clock protein KaiC
MADSLELDPQALEEQGLLVQWSPSPSEIDPDIRAARLRAVAGKVNAHRLFIDSIKDLENGAYDKARSKGYIYSLLNDFKVNGITTFVANEIPELFGSFPLSENGISCMADNIILLRYVELSGQVKRAIHVLKVRGSQHSKEIRELEITDRGIEIGNCLNAITGLLSGAPVFSEFSNLLYLPLRARYVIETLKQAGLSNLADLMRRTGLSRKDLLGQIEDLQQQKMVGAIRREGETLFKVTI